MPRGQHANSRANLAGAAGGDRYAGKRLIIAAIEEALRTLENGREIREFFGLGPARVLKQKHRDRWAEVKAPEVYRALVEGMAQGVQSFEGLRIGGFISRARKTSKRGRLYPVGVGFGPLAANEFQHRRVEMFLTPGNYDGSPFDGVVNAYPLGISPSSDSVSVEGWFYVQVQSSAEFVATFDDGTVQRSVVSLAPAGVLVWGVVEPGGRSLTVTEPDKDWPGGGGGVYENPAGFFLTPAEWRRRRRPVMVDWRAWEGIHPGWGIPKNSGGVERMPIENWVENFPQVRAVVDSARMGATARGAVEWVTGAEWLQRYGAARASYISAGCLCPPLQSPPVRRRAAVTFDADFSAAVSVPAAPPGAP
jgi:hypothetical protein